MAPKSVTFRRHDHLVSVLFGDLLSHSYNITFSMFLYLVDLALAAEAAAHNSQDLQASRMPKNESLLKVQNHRKYQGRSKDATPVLCHRCGGGHSPKDCRFREAECRVCKNKGHIARACRSRKRVRSTHKVTQDQAESQPDDKEEVLGLHHTRSKAAGLMTVTVKANQADLLMEVDTGASASLISEATYKQLWQGNLPRLKKTNVKLRTYSGELLKVLGSITIDVVYEGQNEKLPLLVVAGEGPSLLGKNWMTKIRLNWNKLVHKVQAEDYTLDAVLQKHPDAFKERLGHVKNYSAKIHVDPSSSPRFCKARLVAYALRGKVNAELDRLQQEGIIEPVEFSEWAAPIVPVMKSNGSLRICGDYKVTVNSASKLDKYPLPRIEDLFSLLEGGKIYSKLDLSSAFCNNVTCIECYCVLCL